MNIFDRALTYSAGLVSGIAIGIVSMTGLCLVAYYNSEKKETEDPAAEE